MICTAWHARDTSALTGSTLCCYTLIDNRLDSRHCMQINASIQKNDEFLQNQQLISMTFCKKISYSSQNFLSVELTKMTIKAKHQMQRGNDEVDRNSQSLPKISYIRLSPILRAGLLILTGKQVKLIKSMSIHMQLLAVKHVLYLIGQLLLQKIFEKNL